MANEQAAVNSAPNATVTAQQPAQGGAAPATTLTAQPVQQPAQQPAQAPQKPAATNVQQKSEPVNRDKEQADLKKLSDVVENGDYFEQQKEFAKVFEEREGEDSFRRAARIEREREALAAAGDPTRDPVAKQRAMDMNTAQPGAVEDAEKIKKVGAEKLDVTQGEIGVKK